MPPAALKLDTGDYSVAKRVRVFHHPQYATHHGAAALRVVVQQAQSAQSFLVPQPVLRRVQHTVAAQHLQHTDKPHSGTSAALKSRRTRSTLHARTHARTHTHSLSSASLCVSPSGCWDQLTFLQDLYFRISVCGTRSIICQLTRHGAVYIRQLLSSPLGGHFNEAFRMKPTVIELPLTMTEVLLTDCHNLLTLLFYEPPNYNANLFTRVKLKIALMLVSATV